MSFHYIHFRTFAHATESEVAVAGALANIVGDAEITAGRTAGHFGNPIIIFEARLSRNRDIKDFFMKLKGAGILHQLLDELERRIDEDCNMYLRLDKQLAFSGELALASEPDVVDCRMKVAAYPAKTECALNTAREYLSKLMVDR